MRADVGEGAAARLLPTGAPAEAPTIRCGLTRRLETAMADRLRRRQPPKPSGQHDVSQRLQDRVEPPIVRHGQDHASALGGLHNGGAVVGRERERLLTQDMLARLNRGEGMRHVAVVRRADVDGVDLRIGAEYSPTLS